METVWDVLLDKAEIVVKKQRLSVQELKVKKDKAYAQKRKLTDLVSEYHDRLSAIQSRRHSLAEASSYRHFIVQIQDLLIRSEEECVSFDNICVISILFYNILYKIRCVKQWIHLC